MHTRTTCVTSRSDEETRALGRSLAPRLSGGQMVLMFGSLGAGKSVVARGIGEALGIEAWRGSPTFTLVNEYRSEPILYHVDLYRLSTEEVMELGLEECVRQDSVVLVEWADRAPDYLTSLALETPLHIDFRILDLTTRKLTMWLPECRAKETHRSADSAPGMPGQLPP
jgi:tRNA threonylcarbamoyladenosine biosynthesis protein TsaE